MSFGIQLCSLANYSTAAKKAPGQDICIQGKKLGYRQEVGNDEKLKCCTHNKGQLPRDAVCMMG